MKKTIVAIEDDSAILQLLEDTLLDAGYNVVTAHNGREGLACVALVKPDLIICDIMMPGLDGRKMCHIIRANSTFENTPIVLISAANQKVRRQFTNSTFLLKPFDIDELLRVVEQYTAPSLAA